jgi:AcrR family transcriptional regulator
MAGGYEEMSIRSLAASLGVAPMSLYRHIRDKDDLLGEVTDRLLASAWRPAAAEDDWRAWITEAASRLRDFLVSQPAALHVYLSHPVVSPAAIQRMNAMMSVLRRAGLGEEAAPTGRCTPTRSASPRSRPPGPVRPRAAGTPPTRTLAASAAVSPPIPPPGSSSRACATCSRESAAMASETRAQGVRQPVPPGESAGRLR